MLLHRLAVALLAINFFLPLHACTRTEEKKEPAVFKQQPEIAEIRPQQKPVSIKLKRSSGGDYSWDISGSDADEILKADRKLKESLK
jgi:hypothetical protein